MALPLLILQCLGYTIEEPLLSHCVISPSLQNYIVGTDTFGDSLHWKSWSDVERSVNVESELIGHSLSWFFGSFVKIDNGPSLVDTTIVTINAYWLTFNIFFTGNFKDLLVLDIDELFFLISKDLEPSWVGAPDLHIISSSSILDIPWLIVVFGFDSQRLLVEIPDLSVSSIWSFEYHISVVNEIKVSVWWHLGNNVEWSFNIKTEIFVEFSLLWIFWVFISIDKIPLLVEAIDSLFNIEILVLVICAWLDSNNLTSLIDNIMALISE